MQALYFEDFEPGQQFHSKGATLSESQIMDFALTYDPQPFHIDKVAAAEGPFGGLIASGFQTLSLAFRLFYQANVINACSMGSPGFDKLRWVRPVRPGDTLSVAAEVAEMRPSSSKPDRGTLLMDYTVTNQNAEPVMTFTAIHILARKV
ncbi:MaoC family dehydratase [Pelagibius sp.]|uniref:MaoC family dehydratase n=1 Tax=Pelagibius sp. TaxID=1931238 RepID=UPI003BAEACE6